MISEPLFAAFRSMVLGSFSDTTAAIVDDGLMSGDITWHFPRVHVPLCMEISGSGGFGLCSGPENHSPGAIAIGLSSSKSLALIMPMMCGSDSDDREGPMQLQAVMAQKSG